MQVVYIAVSAAWLASAAVAGFAIYWTGSAWPLLVMILPATISARADD